MDPLLAEDETPTTPSVGEAPQGSQYHSSHTGNSRSLIGEIAAQSSNMSFSQFPAWPDSVPPQQFPWTTATATQKDSGQNGADGGAAAQPSLGGPRAPQAPKAVAQIYSFLTTGLSDFPIKREGNSRSPQPFTSKVPAYTTTPAQALSGSLGSYTSSTNTNPVSTTPGSSYGAPSFFSSSSFNPSTLEILRNTTLPQPGSKEFEAARLRVMNSMVRSSDFPPIYLPTSSIVVTPPTIETKMAASKESRVGKSQGRRKESAPEAEDLTRSKKTVAIASTVTPSAGNSGSKEKGMQSTTFAAKRNSIRGRARGAGRGKGKGARGKRKRDSDEDDEPSEESDFDFESGENNPIIKNEPDAAPVLTHTKSGRTIQKPDTYTPIIPSPATHASKKRKGKRATEASVCKGCLRGYSPGNNQIVFCDGCNTAYHQFCHDPIITKEMIEVPEREWFCIECKPMKKPSKVKPGPKKTLTVKIKLREPAIEELARRDDLIPGGHLSLGDRTAYFNSLTKESLVSLLVSATTIQPSLPLFSPPELLKTQNQANGTLQTNGTSSRKPAVPPAASNDSSPLTNTSQLPAGASKTPASALLDRGTNVQATEPVLTPLARPAAASTQTQHNPNEKAVIQSANAAVNDLDPLDDDYDSDDGYGTDPPAHYPKPGQGLASTLGPEVADEKWLIDEDVKTFSHRIYT